MTHLDLDRIDGLAGRLRESKAEVLRLLAKDAGSLKAVSVISGWIWDTDSALADLTALITRIRELEAALEPFAEAVEDVNDDDPDKSDLFERAAALGLTAGDLRRAHAALQHEGNTQ